MSVKIRVLKPFVFTPTPTPGVRGQPQEIRFAVGPNGEAMEYEVPDEVWAHPWMNKDYADGKIESPAQAALRTEAAAKAAEVAAAEAAAAKARAEAAVARMETSSAIRQEQVDADRVAMNTPRGQLRVAASGGTDMDVPVDELRRRQSAGKK